MWWSSFFSKHRCRSHTYRNSSTANPAHRRRTPRPPPSTHQQTFQLQPSLTLPQQSFHMLCTSHIAICETILGQSLGTDPIRGFTFCDSSTIFIHLSLSFSANQPATCLLPIPSTRATRSTRLSSSFRVKTDAATILNRRHQCIENILHRVFHICKPEFMVGEALLQLFKESPVIYAPQKLSLEYPIGPPSETHSLRRFDAISD